MAENTDLKNLLEKFGEDIIKKMVAIIIAKDKVYTGRLKNSFSSKVIETVNGLVLDITSSAEYADLVDQGGPIIKKPTLEEIKGWSKFRGIEKYATPIWRKICGPSYRVKGIFFTDPFIQEMKNLSVAKNMGEYINKYFEKQLSEKEIKNI